MEEQDMTVEQQEVGSLRGEGDYRLVTMDREDILNAMGFAREEDRLTCSAIIAGLEKQAAEGIRNMKVVQLPYVGSLRINPVKRKLRDAKLHLHAIRKTVGKENYKDYVLGLVQKFREDSMHEDLMKAAMRRIRRRNSKRYDRMSKTLGTEYAEMYITAIFMLDIIEHNEDDEQWYRHLASMEDDEYGDESFYGQNPVKESTADTADNGDDDDSDESPYGVYIVDWSGQGGESGNTLFYGQDMANPVGRGDGQGNQLFYGEDTTNQI